MRCKIIGAAVHHGSGRRGCEAGPEALRQAGLPAALKALGHEVDDWGDLRPGSFTSAPHANQALKALPETAAWIATIAEAAYEAAGDGIPIFLGGDHSIAAGSVAGMARRAVQQDRPLFLLWLDAHSDFHSLDSSRSGNLHGVPLAYLSGQSGFGGYFPALRHPVNSSRIRAMGVRSVDPEERGLLMTSGIVLHDMTAIGRYGLVSLVRSFIAEIEAAGGILHVSLDVDFLDPSIAPGVGTKVSGGADQEETHAALKLLHDSGLVCGLDLAELNPRLDPDGRTARLLVDLATTLMGGCVPSIPPRLFARGASDPCLIG